MSIEQTIQVQYNNWIESTIPQGISSVVALSSIDSETAINMSIDSISGKPYEFNTFMHHASVALQK